MQLFEEYENIAIQIHTVFAVYLCLRPACRMLQLAKGLVDTSIYFLLFFSRLCKLFAVQKALAEVFSKKCDCHADILILPLFWIRPHSQKQFWPCNVVAQSLTGPGYTDLIIILPQQYWTRSGTLGSEIILQVPSNCAKEQLSRIAYDPLVRCCHRRIRRQTNKSNNKCDWSMPVSAPFHDPSICQHACPGLIEETGSLSCLPVLF